MVKYKTFTISIEQDHIRGLHPRKDWDNLGVIASWDTAVDCECSNKPTDEDENPTNDWNWTEEDFWNGRKAYYITQQKIVAILPLHQWYEDFNTEGKGRQVGFIYMPRDKFQENFDQAWIDKYHPGKSKQEIARDILKSEIETYSHWSSGEVYGFTIDELDDSCWGFFGDDHEKSGLLDHARETIDWEVKNKTAYHLQRLKNMIRNKVPFDKRISYKYS